MQKSRANTHIASQRDARIWKPGPDDRTLAQTLHDKAQAQMEQRFRAAKVSDNPAASTDHPPWHVYVEHAERLSKRGDHSGSARSYRIASQQCTDPKQSAFLLLNGAHEREIAVEIADKPAQKKALAENAASDYAMAATKLEHEGELEMAMHAHAKAAIGHSDSKNPFHAPKAAVHAARLAILLPQVEAAPA